MPVRGPALLAFDLPAAPQRIDELAACAPRADACRVHAPAGRFLLLCSEGALAMAFEATLFDLLAESRYPAPRPRRARGGSLIAKLARSEGAAAAAACYAWPPGEEMAPAAATMPDTLEVGLVPTSRPELVECPVAAPYALANLFRDLPHRRG